MLVGHQRAHVATGVRGRAWFQDQRFSAGLDRGAGAEPCESLAADASAGLIRVAGL